MFATSIEDELSPLLDRVKAVTRANLQWGVRETSTVLLAEMRRLAPVGRHFTPEGAAVAGGNLRGSLAWDVGDLGATLMGASYGRYVIEGTRPHPIVARRARALRFWWERQGLTFVGPRVRHPGSRANDFRSKAIDAAVEGGVMSRTFEQILGATLDGRPLG